MHRFPPLTPPIPSSFAAKAVPVPLPSLPLAEIALFGLMAVFLALS